LQKHADLWQMHSVDGADLDQGHRDHTAVSGLVLGTALGIGPRSSEDYAAKSSVCAAFMGVTALAAAVDRAAALVELALARAASQNEFLSQFLSR
jgi:hypothetical protein